MGNGIGTRHPAAIAMRVVLCVLPALLLFVLPPRSVHAQSPSPANIAPPALLSESAPPLQISLLTIGPGAIYFERFGHNAIVVRDTATDEAVAYNYGIFDFAQKNFLLNFVRGHMRYRIAEDALGDDLAMYREEGRSITEQRLNLTAAQAQSLADFLEWNAQPEHAYYRYDYFLANCSTRVRDALDHALGGALRAQSEGRARGYTYRIDALRLMAHEPLLMLGIDLGLGPFADQRIDFWQESFVPATLQDVVGRTRLTDDGHAARPLMVATSVLAKGRIGEPPALPPDLRWPFLILGVALFASLLWLGPRRAAAPRIALALFATAFETFCSLGGIVLLLLWFGTDHRAAWRNENLLLLNPLCLFLLPPWIGAARASSRVRHATVIIAWVIAVVAAFALFSKILPWFTQSNLQWIVLFLPIHLALAINLMRARRREVSC